MPMDRSLYPDNWDELALQIKTEANWCCSECGRPCRQPGESFDAFLRRCWSPSLEMQYPSYEMDGDQRVSKAGRFTLTVAHVDHRPENCHPDNLKALCAPCHCRYDLTQMGRKRVLKAERAGQLRLEDTLNGKQLALISAPVVYQRVDPRSGGRRTVVRKPLDADGSRWTYRRPGNASGWIEQRVGNKKRANPSVSYYYRWDSHKGRVSEYIRASQVTRVERMIEAERPALEILKVVVEGKRTVSGVSAKLLR
ncbi:MAG: HNH endonuclease [Symploca sp. SIO2G7]|nr:HNH endonuclease [Symploca sp. SIO2G7]